MSKREKCRYCGGGHVNLIEHEQNCVFAPQNQSPTGRFQTHPNLQAVAHRTPEYHAIRNAFTGDQDAMNLTPDITPETHPDHPVVGKRFRGYDLKNDRPAIFFCDSHDSTGYNMVTVDEPFYRTNVSEYAIGRTFHLVRE